MRPLTQTENQVNKVYINRIDPPRYWATNNSLAIHWSMENMIWCTTWDDITELWIMWSKITEALHVQRGNRAKIPLCKIKRVVVLKLPDSDPYSSPKRTFQGIPCTPKPDLSSECRDLDFPRFGLYQCQGKSGIPTLPRIPALQGP